MGITEEQKAEAVRLFINGKSLRSIAKQIGVNFHPVRFACIEILGEQNYQQIADTHRCLVDKRARSNRPNKPKEIQERNARLLKDYETGVPVAELAENYKLGVEQIYKIIARKFGGKPRSKAKVRVLYDNYILVAEMITHRNSVSEIASRFHLAYNTVYFWLLRNVSSELLKENLKIGYHK